MAHCIIAVIDFVELRNFKFAKRHNQELMQKRLMKKAPVKILWNCPFKEERYNKWTKLASSISNLPK
jgi:hypothetical protein